MSVSSVPVGSAVPTVSLVRRGTASPSGAGEPPPDLGDPADVGDPGGEPTAPVPAHPVPAPPVATPPSRDRPPDVAPGLRAARRTSTIVAVVVLGFLFQITLLGGAQHGRDQAQAYREFRIQLAIGTAPVGPLDVDGAPLPAGSPVAILEVPALGLRQVVSEGTSSRALMSGPGHRRDTVLPGQPGTSVVVGRRAAYGGPFADLDELAAGQEVVVTTGQGRHVFAVTGVRRAGDPLPGPPAPGEGRLTLATADGQPFQPTDVLRVDARLTSAVQPVGPQVPDAALPANEAVMAGDPSALLDLALWGPLLLASTAGVVGVRYRVGRREAWIIGVPVLGLFGLLAADGAAALLPNVL